MVNASKCNIIFSTFVFPDRFSTFTKQGGEAYLFNMQQVIVPDMEKTNVVVSFFVSVLHSWYFFRLCRGLKHDLI